MCTFAYFDLEQLLLCCLVTYFLLSRVALAALCGEGQAGSKDDLELWL